MAGMRFIEKEYIESKVSIDISVYEVVDLFLKEKYEVLYAVDENEKLLGVITPRDLQRFCLDKTKSLINYDFTKMDSVDYCFAESFFIAHPRVHEIPVVTDSVFCGIVLSGNSKSKKEWEDIRFAILQDLGFKKRVQFYIRQLNELLTFYDSKEVDIYEVFYPDENEIISGKDRNKYHVKQEHRNGHIRDMSKYEIVSFYHREPEFAEEIYRDFQKLRHVRKNGITIVDNVESNNYNIRDGHRLISNAPKDALHKVYIFGPCTALGAYVSDDKTIAYYLQKLFNDKYENMYEVITSALLGTPELGVMYVEPVQKGDIVILFGIYNEIKKAVKQINSSIIKIIDVTETFRSAENLCDNLFNCVCHHNHIVNEMVAKHIFDSLQIYKDVCNSQSLLTQRECFKDYYIPYEIDETYSNLANACQAWLEGCSSIGTIVMNCNPFTKGHRYLIEKALECCEKLLIFVVEEDLSQFSFEDRIKMVKVGTEDLGDKIKVIGSGKYVISKETFAQYFDKENAVTEVESMDYDLRVFGEVVCKYFGIKTRFVGEEPNDVVTASYNETIKRILPEYGVNVIEIPRLQVGDAIVSASKVRALLAEKKITEIKDYVPQTTYEYIKKHCI